MREEHKNIFSVLSEYPKGLGFNVLCKKTKINRVTLKKRLRDLEEENKINIIKTGKLSNSPVVITSKKIDEHFKWHDKNISKTIEMFYLKYGKLPNKQKIIYLDEFLPIFIISLLISTLDSFHLRNTYPLEIFYDRHIKEIKKIIDLTIPILTKSNKNYLLNSTNVRSILLIGQQYESTFSKLIEPDKPTFEQTVMDSTCNTSTINLLRRSKSAEIDHADMSKQFKKRDRLIKEAHELSNKSISKAVAKDDKKYQKLLENYLEKQQELFVLKRDIDEYRTKKANPKKTTSKK